jgi:hypothetical protein
VRMKITHGKFCPFMELKLTLQLGHDNTPALPKEKDDAKKKKQINFSKKYLINHTVKGKVQHNTQTNIYSLFHCLYMFRSQLTIIRVLVVTEYINSTICSYVQAVIIIIVILLCLGRKHILLSLCNL